MNKITQAQVSLEWLSNRALVANAMDMVAPHRANVLDTLEENTKLRKQLKTSRAREKEYKEKYLYLLKEAMKDTLINNT
jgi:L-lactate utilization protein LutB